MVDLIGLFGFNLEIAKTFFYRPNLPNLMTFCHRLWILNLNSISKNLSKIRNFKANRAAPGEELIKISFLKHKTLNKPHLFNTKPQILIHNREHNVWGGKHSFSLFMFETIKNTFLVFGGRDKSAKMQNKTKSGKA